jgi:hypothetical protein
MATERGHVRAGGQPMADGGAAVWRVGKRRVAVASDPQASCTRVLQCGAWTASRRPAPVCWYGGVRRRADVARRRRRVHVVAFRQENVSV